jgi:phage gpG-like protein
MPPPTVHVAGIPELQRKLQRLAADAPDLALRAVRAGAAVLGEGMERRAPTLSDEWEGTIARSIHMKPAGPTAVLVGTNHGLAAIFENGGEITANKKRVLASEEQDAVFGRTVIIPAQPFIRPAVDEDRGKAIAAVKRSATRSLQRRTR